MKKTIIILLTVFTLAALTGGSYLLLLIERSSSNFDRIIMLNQVEIKREHLLLNIRRVEADLYSLHTTHPVSQVAAEEHFTDIEISINECFGCHHTPAVMERLRDLSQQVDQYGDVVSRILTMSASEKRMQAEHEEAHLIGDSLGNKVDTMIISTVRRLEEETLRALQDAHRSKIVVLVLIAAGPVLMLLFALTVIRGVTVPVRILLRATRSLKAGDLDHRIPGLKHEFGELAVAFNDMAGALKTHMRAIQESEKRYRLLFESAADAIFILEAEGDEAGRIVQANPAAAAMHGYTLQELMNMRIQDLDTPEASAAVPERLRHLVRGEHVHVELSHRRKDGTIFPVEASAGLFEVGGHRFVLAIDRDITERKRVEDELQRMERMRLAGEMATGLAHEIKNPLAGIKVSMEALSAESYLTEEDRTALNSVINEIKRIEFLMKGLLNFARPPKPQLTNTDVNVVLNTVAALVLRERAAPRNQGRPINLVSDLDPDLPEIMADPMQLQQIFMNLMLNAVDAMPDGGTLTIRTRYTWEPSTLVIELADTGEGIDAAVMSRIFSPFFTTKSKGTGLGLSITRRLLEEHGGSIKLENNKEGGATCIINLPIKQIEGALTV